jgi:hypothetical protein
MPKLFPQETKILWAFLTLTLQQLKDDFIFKKQHRHTTKPSFHPVLWKGVNWSLYVLFEESFNRLLFAVISFSHLIYLLPSYPQLPCEDYETKLCFMEISQSYPNCFYVYWMCGFTPWILWVYEALNRVSISIRSFVVCEPRIDLQSNRANKNPQ